MPQLMLREMSWWPLAHTDDLQSETALDSETASPASLGAEAAEDDDTPGMPDSDPIAPAPEKVPFESEFRDWRTIPPGAPLRPHQPYEP